MKATATTKARRGTGTGRSPGASEARVRFARRGAAEERDAIFSRDKTARGDARGGPKDFVM